MECYFRNDDEDYVVPNDQESQDSYNQVSWGVNYTENFASMNKSSGKGRNTFEEEIRFAVDMEICGQNGVKYSDRTMGGRSIEGYPQHRLAFEKPDFQLNDSTEIDHMDDIFLKSIFEEDVIGMDNRVFDYSPESHFSMTQEDKSIFDFGSQLKSGHSTGAESLNFLGNHSFPPSMDWDEDEDDDDMSNLNLSNTRQKHNLPEKFNHLTHIIPPLWCRDWPGWTLSSWIKSSQQVSFSLEDHSTQSLMAASVVSGEVPSGQNCWSEQLGTKTSSEDFVLQELERVMAQMSGTTRISFRDALYRLAENSKQHVEKEGLNEENMERPSLLICHDETNRLEETPTESATNAMDRTVAFLMFNQMEFNAQNSPATASVAFDGEMNGIEEQFNYNIDDCDISHSKSSEADTEFQTLDGGDRSVQADFGRENLQT